MSELKPCPFCDGETRKLMGYDYGNVSCRNEHCNIYGVVFSVAKWNTRHIPEGYALVPIEPDDEMQLVGAESVRIDTTPINKLFTANRVYKAMIQAAQEQSK